MISYIPKRESIFVYFLSQMNQEVTTKHSKLLLLTSYIPQTDFSVIKIKNNQLHTQKKKETLFCFISQIPRSNYTLLGYYKTDATPMSYSSNMHYFWRIRHALVAFLKSLSNVALTNQLHTQKRNFLFLFHFISVRINNTKLPQ